MGVTEIVDIYLMLAKKKNFPPKFVSRPFHGFVYKLSGRSVYRVGNEYFELLPGEILFLPKGCSYVVDTVENGDNYLINFDTAVDYGIEPFVIALSESNRCEELLGKMVKKKSNCETRHSTENMAYLYSLMAIIQRQIRSMFLSDDVIRYCLEAEKYIAGNFHRRELTVTEVADAVGVDVAHLRSGFTEMCGMTPKEYISCLRIIKAKKLLVNSDSSIARVSERLGFTNTSYFSRFFFEKTGFYPTEYRNKFKF